jgi:hypothetical protein
MNALYRYSELGWKLLPCHPRSKIGRMKWSEASAARSQLRHWCSRWPGIEWANWAVLLGEASGLLVVDVEGDRGDAEIKRRRRAGQVPLGPQCNSGSIGRGYHLYFRRPPRLQLRGQVWIHNEIEIRADRMLVLLPPSIHPETGWNYTWETGRSPWHMPVPPAPAWILEALKPRPIPERKPVGLGHLSDRFIAAAIGGEAEVVAQTRSCRNRALYDHTQKLFRKYGARLDAGAVRTAMLDAAAANGLLAEDGERACLATIDSAITSTRRMAA